MQKIYPEIEFSAECLNDGADLDITGIVIPGMRCLADATCPTCGARYYIDLPVGHALWNPIILNQETAEIYDPLNIQWFSNPLKEGFLNPVESEIVPVVHKFFEADCIVIVNCLDFLYGHSLLKLLNVQHYLEHSPELGCCVLVPTQLVHLVPDGIAEIWEFPIPIKDGWKWYPSLQRWISQEFTKRKECFLSRAYCHPSNRVYDLRRFVRNLPNILEEIREDQLIIVFSYREDRLWGRTIAHQQHNLQKLYNRLSAIFPDMAFVLVGFGQQNRIRAAGGKLIDLRTDQFDVDQDRLWMAYMSAADCVIGIHGSNMLLPSGLAKSTVELVPRSRWGNTVQDFLFAWDNRDNRDALLYYRMLYGNQELSNVHPSSVADMVANVLSYASINSAMFKAENNTNIKISYQDICQSTIYRQAISNTQHQTHNNFLIRKTKQFAELILAAFD
jgi:hypothetical protein